MSIISIILAVIMIGLLIVIHEFGHFIIAKKNGVFVKEFSVGFGPRLLSHVSKKSGTRFSLKAIPFGGSCQMLGMLEDEEDNTDDERSFDRKSVWARMSIILAGPVFNFLLAFLLAVIVIGARGYDPAVIGQIVPDSAMEEAGFKEGDRIIRYNGSKINFAREVELENFVHPIQAGNTVEITYLRDGKEQNITVTPKERVYYTTGFSWYATEAEAKITDVEKGSASEDAGMKKHDVITTINGVPVKSGKDLADYMDLHELTKDPLYLTIQRNGASQELVLQPKKTTSGFLGFAMSRETEPAKGLDVLRYSAAEMKYEMLAVLKSIRVLFSEKGSLDMLSGPVGIVEAVGNTYAASEGSGVWKTVLNLLELMMLLSTNLGIINLLPFPAFDGGRFVLLAVEAVRRKPIKKKYEGVITMVGAVLILLLSLVVLVNDVIHLF